MIPRRTIAAIIIGLALPGCSGGDAPGPKPAPAGQDPAGSNEPANKKGGKLRPGAQVPGSSNYEDKPGGRGRGR